MNAPSGERVPRSRLVLFSVCRLGNKKRWLLIQRHHFDLGIVGCRPLNFVPRFVSRSEQCI